MSKYKIVSFHMAGNGFKFDLIYELVPPKSFDDFYEECWPVSSDDSIIIDTSEGKAVINTDMIAAFELSEPVL